VSLARSPYLQLKLTASQRFVKYQPGPNQLLLTKGDNNHADDIELYRGLEFLERRHIVGKVRGYVFCSCCVRQIGVPPVPVRTTDGLGFIVLCPT